MNPRFFGSAGCFHVALLAALLTGPLLFAPGRARAESRPPDIVVYLADDLSVANGSPYGERDIATPGMRGLAAAGMTFDRAYVASPSCGVSRAAMLTGLMPARNGAEENHSFPNPDVLALTTCLSQAGYQMAAFGKVAHRDSAADYHFEVVEAEKDFPGLSRNVRAFLETRTDPRPLALFVGTSSPHVPWPEESTVDPAAITLPAKLLDTPRTRVQRSRYLQEVIDLDAYLAELRVLADEHLSDDTMFVFTSDHGSPFAFAKWTLYEEGIRVPLIVSRPGHVQPGSRTDAMVSWVDLLPTLIDVAGGVIPPGLDGASFAPVLAGETQRHRELLFATHSGDLKMNVYLSRSVRDDRHKLIWNPHPEFAFTSHLDLLQRDTSGDYFGEWQKAAETDPHAAAVLARYHGRPEFELFDLRDDPEELHNLANEPRLAATRLALFDALQAWMAEQNDELRVLHEPLLLSEPQTWVTRPTPSSPRAVAPLRIAGQE